MFTISIATNDGAIDWSTTYNKEASQKTEKTKTEEGFNRSAAGTFDTNSNITSTKPCQNCTDKVNNARTHTNSLPQKILHNEHSLINGHGVFLLLLNVKLIVIRPLWAKHQLQPSQIKHHSYHHLQPVLANWIWPMSWSYVELWMMRILWIRTKRNRHHRVPHHTTCQLASIQRSQVISWSPYHMYKIPICRTIEWVKDTNP